VEPCHKKVIWNNCTWDGGDFRPKIVASNEKRAMKSRVIPFFWLWVVGGVSFFQVVFCVESGLSIEFYASK
jgi:hypothetical protein